MDKYMVQKLWCSFLKKKMETEMGKYRQLEEAFQKIRTSTGNSDVQELVNKFLTREQTYAQLLGAVGENEKTVDSLRRQNDQKEEELNALRIANEDSGSKLASNTQSEEMVEIQGQINEARRQLDIINNRKKNVHLICDQIGGWSKKTVQKLNNIVIDQKTHGARQIDLA